MISKLKKLLPATMAPGPLLLHAYGELCLNMVIQLFQQARLYEQQLADGSTPPQRNPEAKEVNFVSKRPQRSEHKNEAQYLEAHASRISTFQKLKC